MHFSVTAILYTLLPTGITEVFFVDINSNTSITHYFQILSCWDVTWIMSHLTQSRQCTAVCALSALGPLPVQYKGTGTCTSDHHVLCVQYAQHCHFFSRAFMHSRNTPWSSSPASHIILLPPTCRHICKASKTKLRFMKIHTEGSCPSPLHSYLWLQTPQALPHQRASEPHRMSISTLSIAQKMQVMLLFGTIA